MRHHIFGCLPMSGSLTRALALSAAALMLAGGPSLAQQQKQKPFEPTVSQAGKDVVWVPTNQQLVDKMLDMAKAVDTLMVMTPGGATTNKLISAEVINALGPNGVIINMSRGSVVDEEALIAALKKGDILAAGLDVYVNEPNVPEELRALPNVVLLPHIGSASVLTRGSMDQLVAENIKDWFAGKVPPTPVPETPVKGR